MKIRENDEADESFTDNFVLCLGVFCSWLWAVEDRRSTICRW